MKCHKTVENDHYILPSESKVMSASVFFFRPTLQNPKYWVDTVYNDYVYKHTHIPLLL